MKPGVATVYVNAVIAAVVAGALTAVMTALFLALNAAAEPWTGSVANRILAVPATFMLGAVFGTKIGVAIGLAVGATFSAAWALIQRQFRLGFLSDLLFIATVIALYMSLSLRAPQAVGESILVVASLMGVGSVIAAVTFRRLLHLSFALELREAR